MREVRETVVELPDLVRIHGLIHSWSFMNVAVARGCPGLASFLASIGVASQDASNLGSYMMEASWPKFDGYWNIIEPPLGNPCCGIKNICTRGAPATERATPTGKQRQEKQSKKGSPIGAPQGGKQTQPRGETQSRAERGA